VDCPEEPTLKENLRQKKTKMADTNKINQSMVRKKSRDVVTAIAR